MFEKARRYSLVVRDSGLGNAMVHESTIHSEGHGTKANNVLPVNTLFSKKPNSEYNISIFFIPILLWLIFGIV